jgi:hypothetical protein
MKYLFVIMTLIFALPASWVGAQSQPIFINPYKPGNDTYTSRVPTTVQSTQQQGGTFNPSNRLAGPGLTNNANPFAGTGFGRIKQEISYYDEELGRGLNQYDYMALMARRGNNARLSQVRQYVQENGVFDPNKYRQAMTTGPYGSNPQVPVATNNVSQQSTTAVQQPRRVIMKQDEQSQLPRRVHRGYDDEPAPAPSHQPGAPIFLR